MNVAAILKEKGRDVITAGEETTILEAARLLHEHGIGSIVITDTQGSVKGIVSERDIVRALATKGEALLNEPVSSAMTRDVFTCRETDTIEQLMAEMTSRRFRHLPVVEGNDLVGIVSIGDVVKQRIAEAEMEAAAMREYIATG